MQSKRKQVVSLICLLAISLSTLAVPKSVFAGRPMDGFYLGGQGEYALLDLSGTYELVPPTSVRDKTPLDRDSSEFALGIFAGWGHYLENDYYLGIEGGCSFYGNEINAVKTRTGEKGTVTTFGINNKYKVNLSGIVGRSVSEDALVYGKIGVAYTDIEVTALSDLGNYYSVGSVHDWIGGTAGVGIAYNFWGNLALRAEYNFTTYFIGPKYDNDKNDGEKTDYDLYDNRFTVGVVYSF
ncbi:outer membrane protein [Desulfogranum mediterraneum]|uniref:outer membrane protein n=1 Tax=Desulfogranum mediterraneum TaxID=160661 RepID=UPI000A0483FF|nr:porin family protein [Desulfogranum mediterraneum]